MPTDLMRAQLGEGAFQILTRWWRINDLMPIVEAPAPILNLRRLAFNFLLAPMDELAVLIRDLTPGPGVPAFVALGLERARFLHRHRAQLPLAQAMLAAAGNDITRADALMQFLAPYLAHPARLAVARAELQRLGYDIPQAAPVVAFLAPYAADPVALPVARQELASAAGQVATAQAELDVLARYNYDRATRDGAKQKAQAVETAELKTAADGAHDLRRGRRPGDRAGRRTRRRLARRGRLGHDALRRPRRRRSDRAHARVQAQRGARGPDRIRRQGPRLHRPCRHPPGVLLRAGQAPADRVDSTSGSTSSRRRCRRSTRASRPTSTRCMTC
jgi:hypothetical protein